MPRVFDDVNLRIANYTLIKFKDHPDFDDYTPEYKDHLLDNCNHTKDWNELMAISRNVLSLKELPKRLSKPIKRAILEFDREELVEALLLGVNWHNWRKSIKLRERVK